MFNSTIMRTTYEVAPKGRVYKEIRKRRNRDAFNKIKKVIFKKKKYVEI